MCSDFTRKVQINLLENSLQRMLQLDFLIHEIFFWNGRVKTLRERRHVLVPEDESGPGKAFIVGVYLETS